VHRDAFARSAARSNDAQKRRAKTTRKNDAGGAE
jgi:hypothetical protein